MSNLDEVVAEIGIPATWDVMIVGDGSGCWWDKSCGWGCVLLDHHLNRRRAFFGGMSSGSIAIAELMPVVHAMLWYDEFHGRARKDQLGRSTLNVHVVTDNDATARHWETLVSGGKGAQKIRRKRPLWNVLLQLERSGYIFHFHWIPRDTVGLNKLADKIAGVASKAIGGFKLKAANNIERVLDTEIYTINPSL